MTAEQIEELRKTWDYAPMTWDSFYHICRKADFNRILVRIFVKFLVCLVIVMTLAAVIVVIGMNTDSVCRSKGVQTKEPFFLILGFLMKVITMASVVGWYS